MTQTELELAQLLCTRLCHDLAGPIGAVSAGVELIGDDPGAIDAETLGLIGTSSAAASRKLKFVRAAFGAGGGASLDLKGLVEGYLEATAAPAGRVALTWPTPAVMADLGAALGAQATHTILNLCLLGLELQPGCRALMLVATAQPLSLAIEVRGAADRASSVRNDLKAAAMGDASTLSAKTVQAYLAGDMVRAAGGVLDVTADGNRIEVKARFANAPAAVAARG